MQLPENGVGAKLTETWVRHFNLAFLINIYERSQHHTSTYEAKPLVL